MQAPSLEFRKSRTLGFLIAAFALTTALEAQTLKAVRVMVSQFDDGASIEGGQAFQPGEQVYFSFQVEGYKTSETGKVQLAGHVEAFDPKGTLINPKEEVLIGTSVSEEDKNWKPKLRAQIQVPPIAPGGTYRIKYDVTDQQTKQTTSGEATFVVKSRTVEPSPTLVVRNLGLYRTQDEENALKTAAYRSGDMLWVRFDITGYKYGEQNSIDVAYDVAVLTGAGNQLFSQTDAAVEKSQAFYPQPWVPAEFNLSLQSTMSPGTYTLVITAHDSSGQTATAKANFQVER
jgi:hypothetical protein